MELLYDKSFLLSIHKNEFFKFLNKKVLTFFVICDIINTIKTATAPRIFAAVPLNFAVCKRRIFYVSHTGKIRMYGL